MTIQFKKYIFISVLSACLWMPETFPAKSSELNSYTEAIKNYVCFLKYWENQEENLDITMDVFIKENGKDVFGWTEKEPNTNVDYVMKNFYEIFEESGHFIIGYNIGYNSNTMSGDAGFIKHMFLVKNNYTFKSKIYIPANCSYPIDKYSNLKKLMINHVINTVKFEIKQLYTNEINQNRQNITALIWDFNIESPWTYVFIPSLDATLIVMLTDKSEDGRYNKIPKDENEGIYPVQPINKMGSKKINEKIIHRNITKTISLIQ